MSGMKREYPKERTARPKTTATNASEPPRSARWDLRARVMLADNEPSPQVAPIRPTCAELKSSTSMKNIGPSGAATGMPITWTMNTMVTMARMGRWARVYARPSPMLRSVPLRGVGAGWSSSRSMVISGMIASHATREDAYTAPGANTWFAAPAMGRDSGMVTWLEMERRAMAAAMFSRPAAAGTLALRAGVSMDWIPAARNVTAATSPTLPSPRGSVSIRSAIRPWAANDKDSQTRRTRFRLARSAIAPPSRLKATMPEPRLAARMLE